MPEKKLTRKRIAAHLRRCGIIYVLGIIALAFLNNLIFTMARPRVPEENTVRVMVINQDAYYSDRAKAWEKEVNAADESVRALEIETIWYDSEQYELSMAMPVKLMAGGYDLLVSDKLGYEELMLLGAYLPMDGYLDADEAEEKIAVPDYENEGEEYTGALKMDFLGLKDVYVGIAANSENPDSTWNAFCVLREIGGGTE